MVGEAWVAFSWEGVLVVAHSRAAHVRLLVAELVHWEPAAEAFVQIFSQQKIVPKIWFRSKFVTKPKKLPALKINSWCPHCLATTITITNSFLHKYKYKWKRNYKYKSKYKCKENTRTAWRRLPSCSKHSRSWWCPTSKCILEKWILYCESLKNYIIEAILKRLFVKWDECYPTSIAGVFPRVRCCQLWGANITFALKPKLNF